MGTGIGVLRDELAVEDRSDGVTRSLLFRAYLTSGHDGRTYAPSITVTDVGLKATRLLTSFGLADPG
jgi:hypothetical protein